MKTLKFFVCALFCGVLLLTSCSEDPFSEGFGQDQPGVEGLNTHDDDHSDPSIIICPICPAFLGYF